jgi:hypothetical protein
VQEQKQVDSTPLHPSDEDLSPGTPALKNASLTMTDLMLVWRDARMTALLVGKTREKWIVGN